MLITHYQPYWNKMPGQFARTADYKLYRNGGFFAPAKDLNEENDLERTGTGYDKLKTVLDACPPAPVEKGSKNTVERPIHPEWRKL